MYAKRTNAAISGKHGGVPVGILRFFGFAQVAPDPNSGFNPWQEQTRGDGETCQEARHICKVLSNPTTFNSTPNRSLRDAVGKDKAHYLYSRFATALGWTTLEQAQRYYDANKGNKGGPW